MSPSKWRALSPLSVGSTGFGTPGALSSGPGTPESEVGETWWWRLSSLPESDPRHMALVELRQFVVEWKAAKVDPFWYRKSGKPVLSVVACKTPEPGVFKTYRGMNTEVSLPSGSLCAERAAIAKAATDFCRSEDIVVVAVVDPSEKINPLWPCEVCQSWLSKLRTQSKEIASITVANNSCEAFLLKVNGQLQMPPMTLGTALPDVDEVDEDKMTGHDTVMWASQVKLNSGCSTYPWECKSVVYLDGSWAFMHPGQQHILKVASQMAQHVIVGVHTDACLLSHHAGPVFEPYNVRINRLQSHRFVNSVLTEAPWEVGQDMIKELGITEVISGSVTKWQDIGFVGFEPDPSKDPYRVPKAKGIFTVIPSCEDITEKSIHDDIARLLSEQQTRLNRPRSRGRHSLRTRLGPGLGAGLGPL